MKKKKFILVIALVLFLLFLYSFINPIFRNYNEYFSEKMYFNATATVGYNDIFYNPKSKLCELYSVGRVGHIDLNEISNRPQLKEYYREQGVKIFDEKIIDKFNKLLQECRFIPVARKEAFKMSFSLKKSDFVTYSEISTLYWMEDENIDLFSIDVINEINEQIEGICCFTVFEKDNKLYLFGAYAYEMFGASWIEHERPNFADTKAVIYEIEKSKAADEIIQIKEQLYPGDEDILYKPYEIRYVLLGVAFISLVLLLILSIRGRYYD